MARYFFDLETDKLLSRDDVGCCYSSLRKMRDTAVRGLLEAAADAAPDGVPREIAMKVRPEGGGYIFEARLTLETTWVAPLAN